MIPNTGYGAGLSRVPSNYYTNNSKVEAYFSDASLVAYDLENFRIYFNFDVEVIEWITYSIFDQEIMYELVSGIKMIGDSCELIIYKI